jgi:hypothetical protein
LATALALSAADLPDATTSTPPDALAALEARAPKPVGSATATPAFRAEVEHFIEADTLASADDFFRAASLFNGPITEFRSARLRYELLLVAAAKQHPQAAGFLPLAWDMVLCKLGRPMRYDAAGLYAYDRDSGAFALEPAPDAIRFVWHDPAAARERAAAAADNAEVQTIVEADQAARMNWSALTAEQQRDLPVADRRRNNRIREIVVADGLRTAADYARASLVLQHSAAFDGYRLAHELAVCALLLGDRGIGRWLVAATYDRMLNSVGLEQRFGTQGAVIVGFAAKPVVAEVDERGICDTERHALGCLSLAAKRADFFAPAPRD